MGALNMLNLRDQALRAINVSILNKQSTTECLNLPICCILKLSKRTTNARDFLS